MHIILFVLFVVVVVLAVLQLYTLRILEEQHECFHLTMELYAKKEASSAEGRQTKEAI